MKVGLFTALLAKLSFDEVIQKIKPLGISTVELGVGNYPGDPHLKLEWLHHVRRCFFPTKLDDVTQAFSQIQDELRSQYALAYKPVEFVADGRFHSVAIESGRKGLRIRSRRGYYAPKP